ncbi:MAG: hypothetical protein JXR11_10100 [Balneola sp.]
MLASAYTYAQPKDTPPNTPVYCSVGAEGDENFLVYITTKKDCLANKVVRIANGNKVRLPGFSQGSVMAYLLTTNSFFVKQKKIISEIQKIDNQNKLYQDSINNQIDQIELKINTIQTDVLNLVASLENEIIEQSLLPDLRKDINSLTQLITEVENLKLRLLRIEKKQD